MVLGKKTCNAKHLAKALCCEKNICTRTRRQKQMQTMEKQTYSMALVKYYYIRAKHKALCYEKNIGSTRLNSFF